MKKMKRYALLLAGLTLLSLAGCGNQDAPLTITDNPASGSVSADATLPSEPNGDIPAESDESENPAESASPEQTSESRTPAWAEEQKPAQSSSVPIESSKQEAQPVAPKEPEPQESKPALTQASAEKPPQREPEQETAPSEEPTIPDFNIQAWISYAETYAISVGLRLESSAVDCWDNPITAGAHSSCLQRDIESRLNRYSRDEDITDVWIWAEKRSDGSYDLYIGYA